MLPDKNELNNEITEQISGGGSYPRLLDPSQGVNSTQESNSIQEEKIIHARALPSAGTMEDLEQLTDGYSPNCETQITPKIISVGSDLKTTVPNISDKDKLVKIH